MKSSLRMHGTFGAALQRSDALARSIHSAPLGTEMSAQLVVLGKGCNNSRILLCSTHHPCLGSERVCHMLRLEAKSP
jgi:hypothetical protein